MYKAIVKVPPIVRTAVYFFLVVIDTQTRVVVVVVWAKINFQKIYSVFLRYWQPSVRRALPPVGWQSMTEQLPHSTTVWAWLNTVVLRSKQQTQERERLRIEPTIQSMD